MDPKDPHTVLLKTCRISVDSQAKDNGTIWDKHDGRGPRRTQYLKIQISKVFIHSPPPPPPFDQSDHWYTFKQAPNTFHLYLFV